MKTINMKKRLKRTIVVAVALILFLFTAGYVVAHLFVVTFNNATQDRMYEEADNYRSRINREIDQNFQLLNTVASLVGSYNLENVEGFDDALRNADSQNDFLLFGYFGRDGSGLMAGNELASPRRVQLEKMQEPIQEAVRETFQGKEVISNAFLGKISNETVFVFSVPVYRDGELIGALMASDAVDVFTKVLDERNWFYGSGYVHLLDQNGEYLIRNQEKVVQEEVHGVFEQPYLAERDCVDVQNRMKQGLQIEFSFQYRNMEYQALLEPVGVNGWYLFCINSLKNVNQNIYHIAYAVAGFFVIIVLLFVLLLFSEYHLMKRVNFQLQNMAYYDGLTHLFNLRRFTELASFEVEKGTEYSIAAVNIRQFKFINEIFGKEQANRLLVYMANVIQAYLKEGEFACRESADMFYIFLRETDPKVLEERTQKVLSVIVQDNRERGNYQLGVRGGIAVAEEGEDVQQVITHAMFSLAKAKQLHKSGCHIFDQALHEKEQMDNYVESHAIEALREGEFQLYLQPKVNLKNGELAGAEALVRWVKPDHSVLYPGSFIPIFETNGFCVQLDLYMFEQVCKQLRSWMDEGITPIPISINQSKATFYEENYEDHLKKIVDRYEVDPKLITLEILEGLVIDDLEQMNQRLECLRAMGFKISMDDFGTGYSSLNTLGKLKIDELKLDRGFLLEATEGNGNNVRLIMEEIVQLSKKLSIDTVIEGIETQENEDFVREIQGDYGQGYWFSKPVDVETFTKSFLQKKAEHKQQ